MIKIAFAASLCAILTGCDSPSEPAPDLGRGRELYLQYKKMDSKSQHQLRRDMKAAEILSFTMVAIPTEAEEHFRKHVDPAELTPANRLMLLTLMGGDLFENWGEKRLAEGNRLTPAALIHHMENSKAPSDWRLSLRGYVQHIVFENQRDGHEIGLTDGDIQSLQAYLKKQGPSAARPPL